MREVARIIDGVLTVEGSIASPREIVVHHHHHHHHHHHSHASEQPVQQQRSRSTYIAPARSITVQQITETMAAVVRAAREMDEDDQRRVYKVMHGSLSLVSAMITLDHSFDNNRCESALRRKA
jgi:hypothetical protein